MTKESMCVSPEKNSKRKVGKKTVKFGLSKFKTVRKIFCSVCNKECNFYYNKVTGHSECDKCGNSFKKWET